MKSNWLAAIFDWLGDALERFNPSAFRFLSAILPYLTPVPVAWLTAHSSAKFLNFTPQISFVFVFALEGIGLWFTTMLVDSVVEWVRSKNWKSFLPVLLFIFTVGAYVYLLVNLNVTLESATGNVNPALSRVITLMCFLPLITGVGNGYYKLKLEYKTAMEVSKQYSNELAEKIRQENRQDRMERYKIKHDAQNTSESNTEVPEPFRNSFRTKMKTGRPSVHQERVFSYLEKAVSKTNEVPTFSDVMRDLNLSQATASRLRNEWIGLKESEKRKNKNPMSF